MDDRLKWLCGRRLLMFQKLILYKEFEAGNKSRAQLAREYGVSWQAIDHHYKEWRRLMRGSSKKWM